LRVALGVIYVEGDGNLATKTYGFPAVYYDAVGDVAGARLGPYPSLDAAKADYAARQAAKKRPTGGVSRRS
jgi:hypothetical protein